MRCILRGHQYVTLVGPTREDVEGNCILRMRCSRCGKITSERSTTPHIFASITCDDVGYKCEITKQSRHVVYVHEQLACETCGYRHREWKLLYEEGLDALSLTPGAGTRDNCLQEPRECPSCHRFFTNEGDKHDLAPTGKYQAGTDGCWPEVKCKKCGYATTASAEAEPHDFGDWSFVSTCESTRQCKRCAAEEVDDRHQWVDGPTMNQESTSLGSGDDWVHTWDVTMTCRVCGQTRDEHRSDY